MQEAVQVTAPVVAVPISSILSGSRICSGIILQSPSANSNAVYFGSAASQPFTLAATGEKSPYLPVNSAKNIYIKGDGTDTIIIGLL